MQDATETTAVEPREMRRADRLADIRERRETRIARALGEVNQAAIDRTRAAAAAELAVLMGPVR